MDTHTIQSLALQASQGNHDALARLYDRFVEELYRFVFYKTQHTQTAEDLCSDIFTKMCANIESYDESKANFRTWLYTIARYTIIDHYRKKTDVVAIEDVWDLSSDTDLLDIVDAQVDMDRIAPYMAKLSSDQREILILRLWEDKSYKEIAEIMGKSQASCKMSFSRAIKTLRALMPLSIFLMILLKTSL